jgi:hypothetical protein
MKIKYYIIRVKQTPFYYYFVNHDFEELDCFILDKEWAKRSAMSYEEAETKLAEIQETYPTLELVLELVD